MLMIDSSIEALVLSQLQYCISPNDAQPTRPSVAQSPLLSLYAPSCCGLEWFVAVQPPAALLSLLLLSLCTSLAVGWRLCYCSTSHSAAQPPTT
ncbi:hypothetical protein U1Q18_019898 [Sarracenia purpurea var. burkii]